LYWLERGEQIKKLEGIISPTQPEKLIKLIEEDHPETNKKVNVALAKMKEKDEDETEDRAAGDGKGCEGREDTQGTSSVNSDRAGRDSVTQVGEDTESLSPPR